MKKIISILMIAAMILALCACGGSGDSASGGEKDRLAEIKERGYIEVVTEPYFAPYEFVDLTKSGQEQYVGMDMEIAKYIADKIGVELKIVPLEFTAVQAGVIDGKYDLAISAIAYSPAREENMAMSKGYFFEDNEYGFLCRAEDVDKYTSVEALKDAVVITQSGSVQEAIYNENVPECKEFKLVSSMTDGYLAVAEGKADVCICSVGSAALYAEANGGLAIPEFYFDVDPEMNSTRVAACKEGTESLMAVVNECIDELLETDQMVQWFDEYAAYAAELGIE